MLYGCLLNKYRKNAWSQRDGQGGDCPSMWGATRHIWMNAENVRLPHSRQSYWIYTRPLADPLFVAHHPNKRHEPTRTCTYSAHSFYAKVLLSTEWRNCQAPIIIYPNTMKLFPKLLGLSVWQRG